jgi:rfaE bifunctional protein nucleotidyltransferase chain/domain
MLIEKKIISFEEAEELGEHLRKKNKKIVFTNGCFDIIHYGHIQYLIRSKSFGDTLIIGVNSNNSIKKIKGNKRPINDEKTRTYILASFFFVDYVITFEEENPIKLIKKLKPNVHIKGGDYKKEDLIEYHILKTIGANIKILPYQSGYSTTNIIEKIKKLYC